MAHATSVFPCCFGLPLEIGVQFVAIFDLVYSTGCLVGWVTFVSLDIFANRTEINGNRSLGSSGFVPPNTGVNRIELPPYNNPLATTTTTTKAPWTLRVTTTSEKPIYDYETDDVVTKSRTYSKLATKTLLRHDFIERRCGADYIMNNLFTRELVRTKNIWLEFLYCGIMAEIMYFFFAFFLIMIICCFVEHRGSKVLVMLLWYVEWIPIYLNCYSIILSQSRRLCILQYAWSEEGFRGQTFALWFILSRLLFLKTYKLFLLLAYIAHFLKDGYLKDDFLPDAGEGRPVRKYYKDFYESEIGAGVDPRPYMAVDTSHALGFDDLVPSDVDGIQGKMMEEAVVAKFSIRGKN